MMIKVLISIGRYTPISMFDINTIDYPTKFKSSYEMNSHASYNTGQKRCKQLVHGMIGVIIFLLNF